MLAQLMHVFICLGPASERFSKHARRIFINEFQIFYHRLMKRSEHYNIFLVLSLTNITLLLWQSGKKVGLNKVLQDQGEISILNNLILRP